jgi:hypothetical protein
MSITFFPIRVEPTVTVVSQEATIALLAGEAPLAFETMLALQAHVGTGTLRALAVTSPRRSAIMPEIPTTAEAGFPPLAADIRTPCSHRRARRHHPGTAHDATVAVPHAGARAIDRHDQADRA